MVVVGSDVHKRTHTFVAVDEAGRKVGELTVKADPKGHDKAIVWAHKRFDDGSPGPSRTVGTSRLVWRWTYSTPTSWWSGSRRR